MTEATNHVVSTAGHVDHGKSTLVEALTGTDPDRLAEEKEQKTIPQKINGSARLARTLTRIHFTWLVIFVVKSGWGKNQKITLSRDK